MTPAAAKAPWPLAALLLAVVAVLVDAVAGRPLAAPLSLNGTSILWKPSATPQSTCCPATFGFDEGLEPADWRECAALYSSRMAENGTFSLARADAYVPVVEATDCTLAVKPLDAAMGPYTIGSKDVELLLDRSLRGYSHGTGLAVGGKAGLLWKISKSALRK